MDSPALTKLSDTELDDFILNYERMVKRQDLEDVATSNYLLSIFETLGSSSDPVDPHKVPQSPKNPFKRLDHAVRKADFIKNWESICISSHPYQSDAQLCMLMKQICIKEDSSADDNEMISFGEFVHIYKVVISTMQAIQLCPRSKENNFRERIRSRVAVFLQTVSSTKEISSAQGYLHELLQQKDEKDKGVKDNKERMDSIIFNSQDSASFSRNPASVGSPILTDTSTVATNDSLESQDTNEEVLALLLAEKEKQILGLMEENKEVSRKAQAASTLKSSRSLPTGRRQSLVLFLGILLGVILCSMFGMHATPPSTVLPSDAGNVRSARITPPKNCDREKAEIKELRTRIHANIKKIEHAKMELEGHRPIGNKVARVRRKFSNFKDKGGIKRALKETVMITLGFLVAPKIASAVRGPIKLLLGR